LESQLRNPCEDWNQRENNKSRKGKIVKREEERKTKERKRIEKIVKGKRRKEN
jgi:hypothetical protein